MPSDPVSVAARPEKTSAAPVVVVGAGPAGLMAAEALAERGRPVTVCEAMPTPGRKLLMAGRGGLNITHSEDTTTFLSRFGAAQTALAPMLSAFGPAAVRDWCAGLGQTTFVGSSGRVFPDAFKASPLLRAWLGRLAERGVTLRTRWRWRGWTADGSALRFDTPDGPLVHPAAAVVLALGGASWRKLGSDGAWAPVLTETLGRPLAPFAPANCGFDVGWSSHMRDTWAGTAVKPLAITFEGRRLRGECVITAGGVEGGLIYAFSAALRDALARGGAAVPLLDLLPDHTPAKVAAALAKPRGGRSLSTHLKRTLGLAGVRAALARECLPPATFDDPAALAAGLKAAPLPLLRPRPLDEAISTAGGVPFDALTGDLMLRARPGVFCSGEMLDWEAPTGGYLLTACLATGRWAGAAADRWLAER